MTRIKAGLISVPSVLQSPSLLSCCVHFLITSSIRKHLNRRDRKERREMLFAFSAFFAVKSIPIQLRLRRAG
jgi:hypothetical protein